MPARELFEWAAYDLIGSGKGQQTPDEMLNVLKGITHGR